jgi:predicted nucleotidyltransferase component of viral defense system
LEKIADKKDILLKKFYLAGGTALAIELGHRESIDLDWFMEGDYSTSVLKNKLANLGKFELDSEEPGTVNGKLDKVKVSFFRYNYGLAFPLIDFFGVKLADECDIAAMKIDAISSRGSKKDFIDLYFLLEKYPLKKLLGFFEKKYKNIKYNRLHILKSLVYFEDADAEPMPVMFKKADWGMVKKTIEAEVKKILS